jgi:O-antigen/teichoic acid export membrane protein
MGVAEHIAKTFFTKGFLVFVGLISGIITARWLGPDDRGVLAIITSISATIWVLVNLGTSQASIYYINKGRYKLGEVAVNCSVSPMVLGILVIFGVWYTKDSLILNHLPFLSEYYLAVALIPVPFLILQDSFIGVLRAADRFDVINFRQIIKSLLSLSSVFGVLVVFQGGLGVLVILIIAIEFILAIWMLNEVRKICTIAISKLNSKIINDLLVFGGKSYIQNVIFYLNSRVDLYMIGALVSSRQVAFYDIAILISELLLFLPNSVGFVIMPKLVRESNETRKDSNSGLLRIIFIITIFMATGLAIFGYWLIFLVYGMEYVPAYKILMYLIPGVVFSSLNGVTIPYFTSRNRQQVPINFGLLSLVLNVSLNLMFIPKYGAIGAAIVTSLTYSLFSLIVLVLYCRENKVLYRELFVPQKNDFVQLFNFGKNSMAKIIPIKKKF